MGNNAGFAHKASSTAGPHQQAIETLGINFFATIDFTNAMKTVIKSRIVTVASFVSKMTLEKLPEPLKNEIIAGPNEERLVQIANDFIASAKTGEHEKKYCGWTYGMSKMLIRSMTEQQAKK